MTTRRRSTPFASTSTASDARKTRDGKLVDEGGTGTGGAVERVERERARMVEARQSELDKVFDRHDTYLREAFQLERFKTLILYDPEAAKEDNSTVFREYKAQHDLVQESNGAGPSRITRRARTERLQALKVPATPSPSTTRKKKKGQGNGVLAAPTPSMSPSTFTPSRSKSKSERLMPPPDVPASASAYVGKGKGKGKAKALPDPSTSSAPVTPYHSRFKKAREAALDPDDLPPAKRRKVEPNGSSPSAVHTKLARHTTEIVSANVQGHSIKKQKAEGGRASTSHLPPVAPSPSLKRIKLIVRRPDPVYSSPKQIPGPPRFGSSLTALLSSFHALDGNEVTEDAIEDHVQHVAGFWRRVDELRIEGRFFPESMGDDSQRIRALRWNSSMNQSQDAWSHIIEAVQERAVHKPPSGRQVAAQVTSRVRAYWESRAVKDDKLKLQEEKRLRALAKATIRQVVDEWKKAVHHIRREEQLRWEEEERIRGQEHLDAILDQSGQILTAQQMDLSKASATPRSRSSSVSAAIGHWASASLGLEGASASEGEDGGAFDEDSVGGGETAEDENADTQLLLGDGVDSNPRSPSSHSRSSIGLAPHLDSSEVPSSEPDPEYISLTPRSRSASTSIRVESVAARTPSPPRTPTAGYYAGDANSRMFAISTYSPGKADWGDVFPFAGSPKAFEFNLPDEEAISAAAAKVLHVTTLPEDGGDRGSSPVPTHESAGMEPEPMDVDKALPLAADVEDIAVPSMAGEEILSHDDPQALLAPALEDATSTPEETASLEPAESMQVATEDDRGGDAADDELSAIPVYLRPYAVAPVEWDPSTPVKAPFLLRGNLRPYQQAGLEWLASLHLNNLNGILADEMGLGKTIQTISLLAHLACDRGIWGPHLIIVPTSVLLNWEMEFKKFLPGFKVLSYHGNTKQRKELRQGWNNKYQFNVCVTSYTLASRDAHVFKRKAWYYMILDEAHMIKNFRSQRWNILLMFRSFRRLLLTGTPLQNNLTELWALLQFLMSGTNFANLKEFGEWFSNPLEKAIEMGTMDDETQQRVSKLHMVLRPYLLRRLKRDVEKELPQKYEHLVMCPLSKRQRFLYDEFMERAETRHDLQSGVYQKIANILMQLRKVVNHPNLFEVRPIVTSFAMEHSAVADFEIKELLVRRRLLAARDEGQVNMDLLGLQFLQLQNTSQIAAAEIRELDATPRLPLIAELPGEPPPYDTRTIRGYKRYSQWTQRAAEIAKWTHFGYLNRMRCSAQPIYSAELVHISQRLYSPLPPLSAVDRRSWTTLDRLHSVVKSYADRADALADIVDRFAFATPAAVARDLPQIALAGFDSSSLDIQRNLELDRNLHRAAVKLQIAFPDPSLLQYDCGKLQELARLLRERKSGGHRILIFTQMTRILDILETFLNFHGYLYLRLDGATKIEDRQYITERFNSDARIFCFISSSRSGGVGINLTGADTVIFYDSDFNPQMDRQCEDRAHRIGQIRDVHIYRFVSTHTIEEALLRKANQKRTLDNIVIQKGEFDWRSLLSTEGEKELTKALGEVEDETDAAAAAAAAREEVDLIGEDERDFGAEGSADKEAKHVAFEDTPAGDEAIVEDPEVQAMEEQEVGEDDDEGGTTVDYMLNFVRSDIEYFADWRL